MTCKINRIAPHAIAVYSGFDWMKISMIRKYFCSLMVKELIWRRYLWPRSRSLEMMLKVLTHLINSSESEDAKNFARSDCGRDERNRSLASWKTVSAQDRQTASIGQRRGLVIKIA